jgi:magnesium transporter
MQRLDPARLETAAQHLVRTIPLARPEESVGEARSRLSGQAFEAVEIVCVTDAVGRLCGLVRLTDLLAAPGDRLIEAVMEREPPTVRIEDDQEHVAGVAVRHGLPAVPVVDANQRLEGVVPAQALLEILRREHIEDLHRLAGIRREDSRARRAMEAPPTRRVHDRLPWLVAGLAGSVIATSVMSGFEHVLERRLAIAFFVPGIVYLADAIGTQTEAIAVRGISLSHVPFRRLLAGELWTGALIGLCLGILAFPLVVLAFHDVRLAGAVSAAITFAGAVSTSVGLLFPWILSRRGADPALGSGPVATILQDVLSILIYFTIAHLLVK